MTTPATPVIDYGTATQHADAVRALAKPFRAIIALGDYLDHLGALDRAAVEAQTKTDQVHAQRDQAIADLQVAKAALTGAQQNVIAAQEEAAKVIAAANATSVEIVANANAEAQAIADKASMALAGVDAQIRAANAERDRVMALIDEQRVTLAGLQDLAQRTKQALQSGVSQALNA